MLVGLRKGVRLSPEEGICNYVWLCRKRVDVVITTHTTVPGHIMRVER